MLASAVISVATGSLGDHGLDSQAAYLPFLTRALAELRRRVPEVAIGEDLKVSAAWPALSDTEAVLPVDEEYLTPLAMLVCAYIVTEDTKNERSQGQAAHFRNEFESIFSR